MEVLDIKITVEAMKQVTSPGKRRLVRRKESKSWKEEEKGKVKKVVREERQEFLRSRVTNRVGLHVYRDVKVGV